jgi:ribonuclease P protein component
LHGEHTFTKAERLQRGWQFRRAYDTGHCAKGRLLVVYSLVVPEESRRVGMVTSRRVGNAVARNRARRLLREAYRLHRHQLPEHLQLVMVARTAITQTKLRDVETEMLALWQTAGLISAT